MRQKAEPFFSVGFFFMLRTMIKEANKLRNIKSRLSQIEVSVRRLFFLAFWGENLYRQVLVCREPKRIFSVYLNVPYDV
jgi:hypothetical protein